MRDIRTTIAAAVLALACTPVPACSIAAPGSVDVAPRAARDGEPVPPPPAMRLEAITRGNGAEPQTSCSDLGMVSLSVPDSDVSTYLFELVSSTTEFPNLPAGPVRAGPPQDGKRYFVFPWIDGAFDEQEAIHLRIRVTALSPTGARGGNIVIAVDDPGR